MNTARLDLEKGGRVPSHTRRGHLLRRSTGSVAGVGARRSQSRNARSVDKKHLDSGLLSLTGRDKSLHTPSNHQQAFDYPIAGDTDPRWVLAVRTAELLDGEILPQERRQSLVRLGKLQGLTPFSVSLIIAIVQDQARRGYAPENRLAAAEPQLRMVPLPQPTDHNRRVFHTAFTVVAILAIELMVMQWWLLS